MAQPNPYELVSCPYNKAHQVEHYRMHIHLQKCRKQYPNCRKEICPFDSTHVVNDVELEYHISTCPKRVLLDRERYVVDDEVQPVEVIPAPIVECSENWDNVNVTSYKPDLAKKGAHVILKARGLTPSERKKVRCEGIKTYKPPGAQ